MMRRSILAVVEPHEKERKHENLPVAGLIGI